MRLRSRLSGEELTSLPEEATPDLFEVMEASQGPSRRLVPAEVGAGMSLSFLGRWPESIDTLSLERTVDPLKGGAPWSTWVETLPLVPRVDERVRLHPLEREMLKHLPHLQHVCHRPRLHLRIEEERLPVSRARRVSNHAIATLVSHEGDWESRTLRSIQPKRVLAVQIDDEYDLYENRVAARLVEHLLKWLGGRLEDLQRIEQMARDAEGFEDEAQGSHWRGRRLYTLWKNFFTSDTLRGELLQTIRTLQGLQHSLQALLDSPLYREVPRSTFIPVVLRPTNILTNDPYYRKVAALWRAWARMGHVQQPTQEELRHKQQEACRHFGDFALLLVVRALHELGYHAPDGAALRGVESINLTGALGSARLECRDGAMSLSLEGSSSVLRFVPILALIDREHADRMLCQLRKETEGAVANTVIFVLGQMSHMEGLEPAAERALTGWERPRILPISPWSLDCTERIARVIREWEAPLRFKGYPPRMRLLPDPGLDLPGWMYRMGDSVAVVKPTDAVQREAFSRDCERRKTTLLREQEEAKRSKRQFDPGRLHALESLEKLASRATELGSWLKCPVCTKESGNRFEFRPAKGESWEQWSWWCRCVHCSSEWGLQVCGECSRSFPVLVPRVHQRTTEQEPAPAGWIDRYYGRDLWAEPCWKPGVEVFRCTWCEHCSGSCLRCRQG